MRCAKIQKGHTTVFAIKADPEMVVFVPMSMSVQRVTSLLMSVICMPLALIHKMVTTVNAYTVIPAIKKSVLKLTIAVLRLTTSVPTVTALPAPML